LNRFGKLLALESRAMRRASELPDVVTLDELASALGVEAGAVESTVVAGRWPLHDGRYLLFDDAVAVGRALRARAGRLEHTSPIDVAATSAVLFDAPRGTAPREPLLPATVSAAAHAAVLMAAVFITSTGLASTVRDDRLSMTRAEPIRFVYVATPGPGGGGGGGGRRERLAPPKAKLEGPRSVTSPVPVRKEPPPVVAEPEPEEQPPVEAEPLPPVEAPVATVAGDETTQAGVMEEATAETESRGPGTGGGVGTGDGTGLGEGQGSGIGEGEGGGMGGGPYRPGSGIEPPRLLREVRATYSEEARQRNLQGEVVLEIVVRRDGRVGDVRVLQGLGAGLDQRAMDAVRQWQFAPARRRGTPVDVLVEVAVEFKLR
jgi:TonB family protein